MGLWKELPFGLKMRLSRLASSGRTAGAALALGCAIWHYHDLVQTPCSDVPWGRYKIIKSPNHPSNPAQSPGSGLWFLWAFLSTDTSELSPFYSPGRFFCLIILIIWFLFALPNVKINPLPTLGGAVIFSSFAGAKCSNILCFESHCGLTTLWYIRLLVNLVKVPVIGNGFLSLASHSELTRQQHLPT